MLSPSLLLSLRFELMLRLCCRTELLELHQSSSLDSDGCDYGDVA